jgi:uncharacterized membrane protein (DUF2068 family)
VPHESHPVARRRALRAIAVFEAVKGVAALAASLGLLSLLHHDLHRLAVELIGHFGLNPGDHYPSMVVHAADVVASTNVLALLLLATAYVLVRLVEAYGLWHERAWGEWLGVLSGGLYVPFELRHLLLRPNAISVAVLSINVLVVGFLAFQLWNQRRAGA